MQDRLVELYSSAQRRSIRISAPTADADLSTSERNDSYSASHEGIAGSDGVRRSSSGKSGVNKWATRVDSEKGYELFGRKVIPVGGRDKMKLTLELTTDSKLPNAVPDASTAEVETSIRKNDLIEDADEVNIRSNGDATEGIAILSEEEDEDSLFGDVVIPGVGDCEGLTDADARADKSKTNVSRAPASADDDTEEEEEDALNSGTAGIDAAHVQLELLEESARSLENWLEDMVRQPCLCIYIIPSIYVHSSFFH